jgi:hypothetical protein
MGDGTSNRAVTRSGPRGPIDGDPSDRARPEGTEDQA